MEIRNSEPVIWNGLHDSTLKPEDADITVLGLPFDKAASFRRGAAEAPDRIRLISGHISPTTEEGRSMEHLKVLDMGNLLAKGNDQAAYFQQVENKAEELFKISFPTFIGGDHSVSIPLIKAAAKVWGEKLGVIHLDAHLDLCGELDGNRLSHGCTHRRVTESSVLPLSNISFIGIRSFEQQELDYIEGLRVNIFKAADIYRQGIKKTVEMVKQRLINCEVFYLTLDIDFLDPAFAPGTGTPKPGGFSTRELLNFLRELSSLKFIGMDVVEVSPPLDHNDITSFAAQRAITEAWALFKTGI